VGGSLGGTRTDTAAVGTQLGLLADRLEGLRGTSNDDAPPVRLFVAILLVWLLLPAIGSLIAGLVLLRRTRVMVVTPDPPPVPGAGI
jgi:hypothetical protein